MSTWREENFLEKLAHSVGKQADAGLCAEAEALCASSDVDGTGPMSVKVSQHIEHCVVCSELRQRLALFDQAQSLGLDSEGREAERRLDSWMKGFLASEILARKAPSARATPTALSYPSTPKTRPFWRMQWALAAAAIVIISAGVVYIRRSIIALPPPTEVARTTQDQPPPAPGGSQPSAEAASVDSARPKPLAPKNSPGSKSPRVVSSAKTDTAPASRSEIARSPKQPPQTAAQTTRPATTETPAIVGVEPGSTPSTPVHPILSPERVSLSQGTTAATSADRAGGSCATCSPIPKSPARSVALSPVLIAAGTRIWISFEPTTLQGGGKFRFEGKLLLPATTANAVVLEKGTLVAGFGATAGTQTSLQITEFVVHGIRYTLRTDSGSKASQPPGSGKVVQFQGGKVAEMWLASVSTFDAEVESDASPQK